MLTFGNFGNAAQKLNDHLQIPDQSTRFVQSASTIPARLTAVCVFAAAKKLSVPANTILPVSSKMGPSAFFIELKHPASKVQCTINKTAKIISLARIVYKG